MPKEKNQYKSAAASDEKFRDFFTTTVADIPAEMVRREEEAAEEHKGLFGRLFGHAKPKQAPQAGTDLELPTGEVLLDIRQNFVPCFPGKYAGTDGTAYVSRDDVRLLGSLGHGHTYRRMEQRIEAGILTGQFTHFIPVPVGVTDVHTSLTK